MQRAMMIIIENTGPVHTFVALSCISTGFESELIRSYD
jgi:hypothetical protein